MSRKRRYKATSREENNLQTVRKEDKKRESAAFYVVWSMFAMLNNKEQNNV